MKSLKNNYRVLRTITIGLQTIMLPFGTFVGYEFGSGNTKAALLALGFQTFLTVAQGHIWWLTLEQQKKQK